MNPNLSPEQFEKVVAPEYGATEPQPSKFSDEYARSLGFLDQADMRGENW